MKILLPMEATQVTESKGASARRQAQVLFNMCSGIKSNAIDSIQPIVTKVSQRDQEFDIDVVQSNFDE